jgi:leucyl aminopeptidase
MKISVQNRKETAAACDVLILPLSENTGLRPYADMDRKLNGMLSRLILTKEFTGQLHQISLLHTRGLISPERVLLIGIGKSSEVTLEKLRQAGGLASSYLKKLNIKKAALSTKLIASGKMPPSAFLEGFLLSQYSFEKYKKESTGKLGSLTVLSGINLKREVRRTETIVKAANLARDMVNTPANDMTPSVLVKYARSLENVSVKVIDENNARKLGMGAYISVARGSDEPPKFIVMTYRKKNGPPLVLIGKSITFDSGGISLKPAKGMEKMKYDMAGGAAVLGVMKAVSDLKLPLHLIAILPATENLPGGSASKPGDVVKTLSGKTVEIISTDAEGRLVLADAIGYAKKLRPEAIIDIATLTGACSIALGNVAIAMMGNDDTLLNKMKMASDETNEKVWQMPLYDEYGEYIKSDIADLKNSSGPSGSLVTAGYFLKEFAGTVPWVHLDIAGTAWTDRDRTYIRQGATGIGVRLLLNLLERF